MSHVLIRVIAFEMLHPEALKNTHCLKRIVWSTRITQKSIRVDNTVRVILVTPQMVTSHKVTSSCEKKKKALRLDLFGKQTGKDSNTVLVMTPECIILTQKPPHYSWSGEHEVWILLLQWIDALRNFIDSTGVKHELEMLCGDELCSPAHP